MSFLDQMMSHLNGVDVGAIAARVGLSPEQVQAAIVALGQQHPQPGDTAAGAAAQTGLPIDRIRAVLDHLGGEGTLERIAGMLGGAGGPGGGLGGGLGGMLSGMFDKA